MQSSLPNPICVRVDPALRAQATALAEARGCTLTDVLRAALEREVALPLHPGDAAINPNGALGKRVSTVVAGAARGDLMCQRELFQDRYAALQTVDPNAPGRLILHMEVIAFGRLTASHGQTFDIRRLAGALLCASRDFRRHGFAEAGNGMIAETLSILEQLAEHGDDVAAISSERLIGGETAEVLDCAQEYRRNAEREEV